MGDLVLLFIVGLDCGGLVCLFWVWLVALLWVIWFGLIWFVCGVGSLNWL